MKINIGAGETRIDGFVTCDHDPLSNPDYLVDLEKDTLPFPDNSVDTVIAHHVLEHLGQGYFHCLKELYRVCQNGALIDIRVPHPRHDSFIADPTHCRPITPMGLKLFSKKFNDFCKEQQFASSRLGYYYGVDFEILDFNYVPEEKYRTKLQNNTVQEIEEYIAEHCNVVKEIYIKLIVIKNG